MYIFIQVHNYLGTLYVVMQYLGGYYDSYIFAYSNTLIPNLHTQVAIVLLLLGGGLYTVHV